MTTATAILSTASPHPRSRSLPGLVSSVPFAVNS